MNIETFVKVAVAVGSLILIILLGLVIFGAVMIGTARSEVVECQKWQKQSQEYPKEFYLLRWQHEQCIAHHVFIGAAVR